MLRYAVGGIRQVFATVIASSSDTDGIVPDVDRGQGCTVSALPRSPSPSRPRRRVPRRVSSRSVSGLNQLGLPGPLSKISAMYRHPIGDLELSGAASVLLDHISRAGTLQIGAHAGYRVPFGEHLWIFGQAILQMLSWGPVLLDAESVNKVDLSPPVAGTLAIGAQQRADFGFGVGLTLLLTKSDIETRVDLLFRLLSFEVGPHIKPLFPPTPKPEPPPKVDVALHSQGASALCPPGVQPAPPAKNAPGAPQPTDAVQCVPIPPPTRQCPPGLVRAPLPSRVCSLYSDARCGGRCVGEEVCESPFAVRESPF